MSISNGRKVRNKESSFSAKQEADVTNKGQWIWAGNDIGTCISPVTS